MLLLRIYTLDVNSGELIVFGNSAIKVFIEKENDEVHTLNFELMLIIVPGNVTSVWQEHCCLKGVT